MKIPSGIKNRKHSRDILELFPMLSGCSFWIWLRSWKVPCCSPMCKIVMFGGFLVPVIILQNPLTLLCSMARCFSSRLIEFVFVCVLYCLFGVFSPFLLNTLTRSSPACSRKKMISGPPLYSVFLVTDTTW
jgi:hypothetical protein